MRKYTMISAGLLAIVMFTSCKSLVTAQDVLSQEDKAMKALKDAQEELVELTELKEQYSVDVVKAEIKKLSTEKKKVEQDMKKLSGLSHGSTQEVSAALLEDLEKRNEEIESKISELESTPKEDWSASVESINTDIKELESEVEQITRNLTTKEE